MAATNYTELINRVRTEAKDLANSNPRFGDTPVGDRDGANTMFRLPFPNPVAGTLYFTFGTSKRSQAGFTILDQAAGYVNITAAPDTTTQPFFFDYYFQWCTDAEITKFIDGATEDLGGVMGTDLEAGLYSAQVQFAISRYWKARASSYAHLYATAGGGANASPESLTENFMKLAREATKEGVRLMTSFYTRHGKRNAPASGTISYGISPYTPRR